MTSKSEESKSAQGRRSFPIHSVDTTSIHRKIGIAFFLTSLIPISIMLYMVFFHSSSLRSSDQVQINLKLLVFLSLCAALIGYWIIRKLASAVSSIAKNATEIAQSGAAMKLIQVNEQSQEVGQIVRVFNRITQDLEEKVSRLEHSKKLIQDILKRVGSVASSAEKIDDLLELVVESMVNALDSESGVIMVLEREGKQFKSRVAAGKNREALLRLAARTEGALGWVLHEQKAIVMNRVDSASKQFMGDELALRSLLCMPLQFQGRTSGFVAMMNKNNEEAFHHDDVLLLEHVANQLAIVVENSRLNEDVERNFVETITALAMAMEAKDPYTRGHLQRVSEYAERVGRAMGLAEKDIQTLRHGAFLHDIGKIAIQDRILQKPGTLTSEEMEIMKTHAAVGERIIAPLRSFKDLREIVRHHQEWYNGTGYPDKLKGDQIPKGARILSVSDVYDALTTDRPYRKALSHEVAMKMISDEAGSHFDPEVVKIFINMMQEVKGGAAKKAA